MRIAPTGLNIIAHGTAMGNYDGKNKMGKPRFCKPTKLDYKTNQVIVQG